MPDVCIDEARQPRGFSWSVLLLVSVLCVLVLGGYYLKTRRAVDATTTMSMTGSLQDLLDRGVQAHTAGQLEVALLFYHQVLSREPWHAQAHYNIAQVFQARKQFPHAQWHYEATLKTDPAFVNARLNLGVSLYWQERYAEAVPVFTEVLRQDPTHAQAQANLQFTKDRLAGAQ